MNHSVDTMKRDITSKSVCMCIDTMIVKMVIQILRSHNLIDLIPIWDLNCIRILPTYDSILFVLTVSARDVDPDSLDIIFKFN